MTTGVPQPRGPHRDPGHCLNYLSTAWLLSYLLAAWEAAPHSSLTRDEPSTDVGRVVGTANDQIGDRAGPSAQYPWAVDNVSLG